MKLISARNLSVFFQPQREQLLLRQQLKNLFSRMPQGHFQALRDVSFDAHAGEGIAVLGQNGAGKSTLLSVLAGVLAPSSGAAEVRGRVGALLDLGAGFHTDLTGRENLVLNAALLGLSRNEVAQRFNAILEFSELGDFIDEPLKNYSAGMRLRLAFSVAAHVDPATVMIDEVLAVGDAAFAQKCLRRVRGMREEGRLILCVSHSVAAIEGLCDRAIWLHCGRIVQDGPLKEVVAAYNAFMADPHRRFRDGFEQPAPASGATIKA